MLVRRRFNDLRMKQRFGLIRSRLVNGTFSAIIARLFNGCLVPLHKEERRLQVACGLRGFLATVLRGHLDHGVSTLRVVYVRRQGVVNRKAVRKCSQRAGTKMVSIRKVTTRGGTVGLVNNGRVRVFALFYQKVRNITRGRLMSTAVRFILGTEDRNNGR